MGTHYGIDVSSQQHNGGPIDYAAVVAHLLQQGNGAQPFVIIKITEGASYVNPWWQTDLNGFASAGAAVALYIFDHGGVAPVAEDAYFRSVAGIAAGAPLADDIESPDGLSPTDYANHVTQTLALEPQDMVYLNLTEDQTMPGAPWGKLLWLAEYGVNAPRVPCTIWQYGSGAVPGIVGDTDLDEWMDSESVFNNFFHLTPAPTMEDDMPWPAHDPVTGGNWLTDRDGSLYAEDGAPYITGANLNTHTDFKAGQAETNGALVCVGVDYWRDAPTHTLEGHYNYPPREGLVFRCIASNGSKAPDGSPYFDYKFTINRTANTSTEA